MTEPWILLAACTAGTLFWRALGVVVGSRINPGGRVFQWITCTAYAMLAALISRIMVLPEGMLATTESVDRLSSIAVGFVLFFAMGRKLAWGLIPAVTILTGLAMGRSLGWL